MVLHAHTDHILAFDESKLEFIVWSLDSKGNTYSGDYFRSLMMAVDDFKIRSGLDI